VFECGVCVGCSIIWHRKSWYMSEGGLEEKNAEEVI